MILVYLGMTQEQFNEMFRYAIIDGAIMFGLCVDYTSNDLLLEVKDRNSKILSSQSVPLRNYVKLWNLKL